MSLLKTDAIGQDQEFRDDPPASTTHVDGHGTGQVQPHHEFYKTSPYSRFRQEHRQAGKAPVHLFTVTQTDHELSDPAAPELVLVIMLESDTTFRRNIGDGWSPVTPRTTNGVALTPIGAAADYEVHGPHKMLVVAMPERQVSALLDDYADVTSSIFDPLAARTMFVDPQIASIGRRMWREAATSDPAASLMVDGLTQKLLGRLLSDVQSTKPPVSEGREFDQRTLARIFDFIESRVDAHLTLEKLAGVAHCSLSHFARAFKKTTGKTPHQYLMERRIDRAKHLLMAGDLPLAQVAYDCGFASQSHLTDVFRRLTGVTPARFRRAARL